ncbi:hypothetical protein AB5J56_26145 [Streptomyces sp. R21]|uniref:Uncharacterized protein n=1 Tax=Streptomyces sp. R21 TaxID=3238627 RepID=A0AB39PFZ8_9ACTN
MPEHVSTLQLIGVAVLALATVIWVVGLVRLLRRNRFELAAWRQGDALGALPSQRQAGPVVEAVELTPAERDAFAGLVRQFSDGRP